MKTTEERKAILTAVIVKHQKNGWMISNQTDINCQLIKEKKPEIVLIVVLFLLFVIPGLLYLILMKGNMTVFIEVDEEGKVRYSSKDISPTQLAQAQQETANLNIKPVQSAIFDETTQNLGLMSAKSIADGLTISEEEVNKLITTNQLKGKKIGEKYFVLKEDFDAFMKG